MRSRSIRLALLTAVTLVAPVLTFAGGQPAKYYMPPKGEIQKPANRAWDRRALGVKFVVEHAKKGTGSADRAEVAAPAPARTARPNWGDAAFRK
jgi:hypothetical protein